MPRDPDNKLLTPTFRAKLNRMTGMSPEEKALFQRVGNLVDTLSYAQRQLSNPRSNRRIPSPKIPVPANLQASGVPGGMTVSWEEVDFNVRGDGLAFYEVQHAESITFAEFTSFESVGTRAVVKSRPVGGTLYVRVRSVSKRGLTSDWTQTAEVGVAENLFSADQDYIDPENRTAVLPKPTLQGAALDNTNLDSTIFTGVGAAVGPSPFSPLDATQFGIVEQRNEITFTIYDRDFPFPGVENLSLETIGREYLEQANFYTYEPNFYIRPQILTGSFTDFFTVFSLAVDPLQVNVEFLRNLSISGDFYAPKHPQTGIVYNASMSTLKF